MSSGKRTTVRLSSVYQQLRVTNYPDCQCTPTGARAGLRNFTQVVSYNIISQMQSQCSSCCISCLKLSAASLVQFPGRELNLPGFDGLGAAPPLCKLVETVAFNRKLGKPANTV